MVDAVALRMIESMIQSTCGARSVRVFRVVQQKKNLEQKSVADCCMLTAKEARTRLYQLLELGWITGQVRVAYRECCL